MSLDIYAKIKGKKIPEYETMDTSYQRWSREERRQHCTELTNEVLNINITHNLGTMASKVPIEWHDSKTGQYYFGGFLCVDSDMKDSFDPKHYDVPMIVGLADGLYGIMQRLIELQNDESK